MGKSNNIERGALVKKAMNLFWKNGYHATSTRDLQGALNMRPGSFYLAFGSKQALFIESLQAYQKMVNEQICNSIVEKGSVLDGIKSFFLDVLVYRRHDQPCFQCLISKAISELGRDSEERACALSILHAMEDRYTKLLKDAQKAGELDDEQAARIPNLGRYLQIELMGFRTYAESLEDSRDILFDIEYLFETLSGETR